MPKPYTKDTIYEGLSEFSLGMHSGVEPLLLPPNQLSFASNCTVRRSFITARPPQAQQFIQYGGDLELQNFIETGLFQGAAVYRPDFGETQIIAQIGGRLFSFTRTPPVWQAREITIPGDPNDPNVAIAWMWQSEKWLIINDGIHLPIFYDGVSARRSLGSSHVLAITAANFTVPAIGDTVDLTLTAPYTGPTPLTVRINGAYYEIVESGSAAGQSLVELTTLYRLDTSHPTGSRIDIITGRIGRSSTAWSGSASMFTVELSSTDGLFVGQTVSISGIALMGLLVNVLNPPTVLKATTITATVQSINGSEVTFSRPPVFGDTLQIPVGALFSLTEPITTTVVGTLSAGYSVPAVGSSATVTINGTYSGPDNQVVWIGNNQYTIRAAGVTPPSTTLRVLNLTDPGTVSPVVAPADISSVAELPPGRMGDYGLGRNWMALIDGLSFIAGDIVGGEAGSRSFGFRDSVLKVTENDFLNGGGVFTIPGSFGDIRAMRFSSTLDVSLGQGPLLVFTPHTIFSCAAPIDRQTWQDLTNPILTEALKGNGALGHRSTINHNNDVFYRALDGWRSFRLARRDFLEWSNTPITEEVERVLNRDTVALLPYSSAIVFDNRLLFTVAPIASGGGVLHRGLVALNFDLASSLRQKETPAYDGLWLGMQPEEVITGMFSGEQRAYAFSINRNTERRELYEILTSDNEQKDDTDINGDVPITWSFETPVLFKVQPGKSLFDLVRLLDGEFYVRDVRDTVRVQVEYRPDYYPCWIPWRTVDVCAEVDLANDLQPGYRMRIGLGEPSPEGCESTNQRPFRVGNFFQLKFTITGSLRFMGLKLAAVSEPQPAMAPVTCGSICAEDDDE